VDGGEVGVLHWGIGSISRICSHWCGCIPQRTGASLYKGTTRYVPQATLGCCAPAKPKLTCHRQRRTDLTILARVVWDGESVGWGWGCRRWESGKSGSQGSLLYFLSCTPATHARARPMCEQTTTAASRSCLQLMTCPFPPLVRRRLLAAGVGMVSLLLLLGLLNSHSVTTDAACPPNQTAATAWRAETQDGMCQMCWPPPCHESIIIPTSKDGQSNRRNISLSTAHPFSSLHLGAGSAHSLTDGPPNL
jgi:hypothetical protein